MNNTVSYKQLAKRVDLVLGALTTEEDGGGRKT